MVYLISVGRLKNQHLEALEGDYLQRMVVPKLQVMETKAFAENKDKEAQEVLKLVGQLSEGKKPWVVLLSERGKTMDSPEFSAYLYKSLEISNGVLFFILGGAMGHGKELIDLKNAEISLSPLTFPHKLARLIFVEQYYRAQTLKRGHPYHNP